MFTEASAPQGLYEQSADKKAHLGSILIDENGRFFRYALAGAVDLLGGSLVQSATTLTSSHVSGRTTVATLSGDSNTKGAKTVRLTTGTTNFTGNDFAGGVFANVTSTAGTGIGVAGHSDVTTSSSTTKDVILKHRLPATLLVGASRGMIYSNLYNGVVAVPNTGATKPALGIPQFDVTAGYYFWLLARGLGICRRKGTPVEGQPLMPNTAGGGDATGLLTPYTVAVTSVSPPETITAAITGQCVGVTVLQNTLQTNGNFVLLNLP